MRLGTVRFRQAQSIRNIVFSPDGRFVVTGSGQHLLLLCDAQDGKLLRQLELPSDDVRAFAFSPDGTTIAAVGFRLDPRRNVVVNELTITAVATGGVVQRSAWDDQESVANVAYAAGGKTVATVSLDGTLRLWDAAATNLRHLERLAGDRRISPESIAFSPNAASGLLAITAGATIDLWDVTQHRRVRTIALGQNYRPNCLVLSPDGTTLAAGVATRGAEIRLWRAADGALIGSLKSRKNAHVSHMAYSPDGKVLAAIGSGGPLVFFDITTGKELDTLSSVRLADGPLAFSPDGITLATTGDRQSLHFWEPATGKDRLATPEAHVGDVAALAWLNDGKTLVSGSRDRTVRIWDRATGRPTRMLAHDGWVESLAVSGDGKYLVTGSSYPESAKVQVWNPTTGERIHIWSVEGTKAGLRFLRGVTLTEDNSCVIAAFADGALQGWDVSTRKERPIVQPKLEEFPSMGPGGGADRVHRAVFSRDGGSVAMIGEGQVQVIDIASGHRRFKESLAMMAPQCEFAPDGRSLAITRDARERSRAGRWRGSTITASTIVWLDSLTGHVRREIAIPESGVRSLTFSPDGQAVAVGTLLTHPARGFIRIFRLIDKREVQTIESPCPFIEVLAFTADGKKIAAGLGDTSIVIWDVHPSRLRGDRRGFAATDQDASP
jgi:WD40 repeat protein